MTANSSLILALSLPAFISVALLTFALSDLDQHNRFKGPLWGSALAGVFMCALFIYVFLTHPFLNPVTPTSDYSHIIKWLLSAARYLILLLAPIVGIAYSAFSAAGASLFTVPFGVKTSVGARVLSAAIGAVFGIVLMLCILLSQI